MRKLEHGVISALVAGVVTASLLPGLVMADMKHKQNIQAASGLMANGAQNATYTQSQVIPPIDLEWHQVTGGSAEDVFTSVIETSDGGYLAVGYSQSGASGEIQDTNNGNTDALVVKFNDKGLKVWDRLIGGTQDDFFHSVIQASDGSFIAAGYTESSRGGNLLDQNNGGQDGLLVKLDAKGNKVWDQIFGGSGMDRFYSLIQTSDGHFVVAGESASSKSGEITRTSNGYNDGLLVKFDGAGDKVWHQLIGGSGLDFFSSVIETSDGLVVAGGTYSSKSGNLLDMGNGSQDGLLVKTTSKGVPVWDQIFGGRAYDRFDALVQTPAGGYIAAGSTSSTISGEIKAGNGGAKDGLLAAFDALGKPLWHQLIGGAGNDGFNSLSKQADGNYLAVGSVGGESAKSDDLSGSFKGAEDGLIYHFTAGGGKVWDQITGGLADDTFNSVVATRDQGLVAVGATKSSGSGDLSDFNSGKTDALIVKYYSPERPVVSTQPKNITVKSGEKAIFSAKASGKLEPSIQWQVNTSEGKEWTNLKGEIRDSLSFTAKLSDHGNSYRAVFQNKWGMATSEVAALSVNPAQTLDVIAGDNRYRTAAAISQASYGTAETAILVQADNFPDALAASSLAYAMKAPILLTESHRLHEVSRAELKRLGVKKVVILGGTQAINPVVEQSLKSSGMAVERLAGDSRYHTAIKVADQLKTLKGSPASVILTSGVSFADALSVGSLAARQGQPVVLTDGKYLTLALRNFLADNNIKQVTIIGGNLVVSAGVEDQLKTAGITVNRIAGATRVETSAAIASQAFSTATVAIATNGWNFPDALAAAPYAAKLNAPILLVDKDSLSSPIKTYLNTSTIHNIKVMGGDLAVDAVTRQQLLEAIMK